MSYLCLYSCHAIKRRSWSHGFFLKQNGGGGSFPTKISLEPNEAPAGVSSRVTRHEVAMPVVQTGYKGIIFYASLPYYKVIANTSKNEPGAASFTPEDLTVPGIPQPP
jgi:hypothetical protein